MSGTSLVLLRLALLLLASNGANGLRAMSIRVPEAVRTGDSVTLGCDYDLEQAALYSIKWYRAEEEFYRYVPKESPPSRVFPMPHVNVDVSKSDAREVTLRGVQRELTGYYKCEVSADAPLFHTDIRGAYMIVVDLPNGDPTLMVDSTKLELGDKIRANCTTPGSYPSANITWFINNEKLVDGTHQARISPVRVQKDETAGSSGGLVTARSHLELPASAELFPMGRASVRCEASLFHLYRASDRRDLQEDAPNIAPVMGPTAHHSQDDTPVSDIAANFDHRSVQLPASGLLLVTLLVAVR